MVFPQMASRTAQSRLSKWVNAELLQFAYNWQWTVPVGKPVVFQVELTNHCPMTCEMCPRTHQMARGLGYMSLDLYRKIIGEACIATQAVLLHHFGDSLLHPQLGECIAYTRDVGVRGFLSANPVLLTDDRIAALVDNGLEELVLSLDGVTPETNALVRGPAARNLAIAEARIDKLLDYRARASCNRPRVILQIVEQKQNLHEIEAWIDKWTGKEGLDKIKIKQYITWDNSNEDIIALRPSAARRPDLVCDKPWTSLTVLWDGRVVPCCFDYDGKEVLGDLTCQSLREIWNSKRLQEFKAAHRGGALEQSALCAKCVDKEGYPTRKWYYPLNRIFGVSLPLAAERSIRKHHRDL